MDNTGEAWGTSSAIKGHDGVSTSPLYIFLGSYLSFFEFRLAKKLEKQAKNRYFDITANFEYQFSKLICLFIKFELEVLVVLNIFVRERSLEPPLHLAATELNRQVDDVFTALKFIFNTKTNSFSVIDFLISNVLLHTYRLVRQKEA